MDTPYNQQQQLPPKPDSNMILAVLSMALCCPLTGIPAVIAASKVDSLYYQGNYEASLQESKKARKWAIWGLFAPIIGFALFILFYVICIGGILALYAAVLAAIGAAFGHF